MAILKPRDRHLLSVSTSQKSVVGTLRYGAQIERQLRASIDELLLTVCADRLRLGTEFLKSANYALRIKPPQYRSAISRAYYAMYHSARAVVYVSHGGDDHEAHSVLSQHLPKDFPDVSTWRNSLREARLLRNRADYEPYPKMQVAFSVDCTALVSQAKVFVTLAEQYLRGRGCVR